MMEIILPEEKRQLCLAFDKFLNCKYPVNIRTWIYASRYDSVLHNHDFPQLWYCADGRYLHQVGDMVYECSKGSVIVIPAGVFHKFYVPEGEKTHLLALEVMYDFFLDAPHRRYLNAIAALYLPAFSKDLGHTFPVYQILSRESQNVFEECSSWLSLLSTTKPGSVAEADIQEKLEVMFSVPEFALPHGYRAKAMQLVSSSLNPILKVLRYLNEHYNEKLVEDMLLSTIGISHASLYRYFKSYTSYTFAQYLQIVRIKHVHLYLSRTTYPISYISDVCGFCNTQHMSRTYKKYTGRSPKESRMRLYEFYKHDEKIDFV